MRKKWHIGLVAVFILAFAAGLNFWHQLHPEGVLLWPQGAPGAAGDESEDRPRLEVFLPPHEKATGAAVVICPGGGYSVLALYNEGWPVARWLNRMGVAAFVLEYRLAPRYRYPAPMQDALRAIRFVRYHKAEYGLASDRIGIMGFSAGGHLAAYAATRFDKAPEGAHPDAIDAVSPRPDFAILGYPLISLLPPYAHEPSVANLLGASASEEQRRFLSLDLHVTPATPPVFLFSTGDDKVVPAKNSVLFYEALKDKGVPAELHVFAHGPHGMALADGHDNTPDIPADALWTTLAENWMRDLKLLRASPREKP